MATAQATLMSFNDYQTYLASVNVAVAAANWSGAFTALAQASVVLAGLPQEVITAQQTTRFRMLKEIQDLRSIIALAQAGGGTAVGLLEPTRAR